jgi:hypothetical protein
MPYTATHRTIAEVEGQHRIVERDNGDGTFTRIHMFCAIAPFTGAEAWVAIPGCCANRPNDPDLHYCDGQRWAPTATDAGQPAD